jgi:hypothetical protein
VIAYDVIVSSVHDRADLLERTLRTMLAQLDRAPARVIVHEDVRPGHALVEGRTERALVPCEVAGVPFQLIRTNPGTGLARAMLRLLETATTEFVFYTQEDFDFVRPVPVARCLEIMQRHALNHVRFNKRDTLPVKGAHHSDPARRWTKQEVTFDGQTFCVSDHVYFQANLTRRSVLLEGFSALYAKHPGGAVRCEAGFNHWFNATHGQGAGSVDGHQAKRRDLLRTFIWGGIGEPRFVVHTGAERRSQGWADPEHDRKHGTVRGEKR